MKSTSRISICKSKCIVHIDPLYSDEFLILIFTIRMGFSMILLGDTDRNFKIFTSVTEYCIYCRAFPGKIVTVGVEHNFRVPPSNLD